MADPANIKTCRKCGEVKPHTLDHFRVMNGGPALRSTCRACERIGARRDGMEGDRLARRFARIAKGAETRRQRYASDPVYREAVLQRVRDGRRLNPDEHRRWNRNNVETNRPAGGAYNKRKYAARDREKARLDHKAWRDANPEKVKAIWDRNYQKNKAAMKERIKRWLLANPEAANAARDRRRAKEAGAEGYYTKDDVRELLRHHGRTCFYCSAPLTKFHIDHFIPLARGGTNYPENLRLSCASCNCSKGAKMPWEWMPDRFCREEAA